MRQHPEDRGAVLILTLILTVVLAVVVIALATYVGTGLRTSDVTHLRSETNADGAAAITWAMEEFRLGNMLVGVGEDCDPTEPNPDGRLLPTLPAAIAVNGSAVELRCTTSSDGSGFPVIILSADATKDGVRREVEAVVQFSLVDNAVRAVDWGVDDVPIGP